MRILNSLKVPKNVKVGPLGFFNIHPVAKYQKIEGGPLKNFEKKVTQCRKKRRGKSHSAEKVKGGPFWVLYFKLEAFGCVQNQVLSTFGKSE